MQKQARFVRRFVLSETAYAGIQCDQPIMRPLVSAVSPEFRNSKQLYCLGLLRFTFLLFLDPTVLDCCRCLRRLASAFLM